MSDDINKRRERRSRLSGKQQDLLAQRLKGKGSDAASAQIPVRADTNDTPLSLAQERLWFLHQLETESTAYNIPRAFRLKGKVDTDKLKSAFNQLITRHESLRTTFVSNDGNPTLKIHDSVTIELPVNDLSSLSGAAQDEALKTYLKKESDKLFSLADGPLINARLVTLSPEEHVLFVMTHHAISDGWSFSVLLPELVAFYSDQAADLKPLPIQYADYTVWARDNLHGDEMERQLAYWKEQLSGELPILSIPTDKPRPVIRTHHGGVVQLTLPTELIERLTVVAQGQEATLFMLLLAAFNTLLCRYSGQDEVVVGSPVANRQRPEVEGIIGFFANTLAFRSTVAGDPVFPEYLKTVKETCLGGYDHQDTPFQELVQVLQPERDMSRTPIYQALFSFMDTRLTQNASGGGVEWLRERVEADVAQTDLAMFVEETTEGLKCALEFSADVFVETSMQRMLQSFDVLLHGIAETPEVKLSQLPLLDDASRDTLVKEWNQTQLTYPKDQCIHQLFEDQATKTPDAPALFCDGEALSYAELNSRSNQIAAQLLAMGVGTETFVGVCLNRSTNMIISMMGVLKAGAAYLPLDPEYPVDRLRYMIEDSESPVVIVDSKSAYIPTSTSAKTLCLNGDKEAIDAQPTDNVATAVNPDNLSYVIYTSGSTGKPKGVMVQHGNVVNFFAGMDERIEVRDDGVWLSVTSISFDISVLEIFWSLARGYKLVVYSGADRKEVSNYPNADKAIDFSLFYFSSDADAPPEKRYQLLWEGIDFADREGFHAVWTPERHFHSFGGLFPSPAVASSAIAMRTKNVQIRAGSLVLPLHNPIRVAEEWAQIDNFSNGRVGLALAPGWQPNDFSLAPFNYADRAKVMIESMDIIERLWRGEAVTMKGGDDKEFDVTTLPRPIQKELPLWITTAGTTDSFRRAGALGKNLLTHLLGQTAEELAEKIAIYREARKEAGYDPETGVITLMLHTFIGESSEMVLDTVREPLRNYLRGSLSLFKPWAEVLGLDFDNMSEEDVEVLLDHSFSRYFENNGLFGTPESAMAMVDKLKGIDVDEIGCLMDFGIDTDICVENLPFLNQLRKNALPKEVSSEDFSEYSVGSLIKQHNATHLQCTPSMASMLVADSETREALNQLSQIMIGGEAFPANLAKELRSLMGEGHITNMYGPTETTIWSTTHEVSDDDEVIPIGSPIANTEVYVLDEQLALAPMGAVGELVIAGDGVVRGYLNRPDLTAERFVPDPFRGGDAKMYRTGDLVRYRHDGTIDYLGRNDFQVKIRGYRIELGEIESLILSDDGVKEAVVVLREDVPGDKRLVAYMTERDGASADLSQIKAVLKDGLADYMMPSAFVILDALPLTPNAKVDRKALPKPTETETETGKAEDLVPPQNKVEATIAEIWSEVLPGKEFGINDNFFEIGGHSMLIVHVMNQLQTHFDRTVKLTDLFRYPTIRALANFLSSEEDDSAKAVEAAQERGAARRARMGRRRRR